MRDRHIHRTRDRAEKLRLAPATAPDAPTRRTNPCTPRARVRSAARRSNPRAPAPPPIAHPPRPAAPSTRQARRKAV
ncbi:hypothetical protein F3087_30850 [Nocardia colli]|uniref:Uncharacterized protein n=1 Tax=Nocardia colli TaxID=2545717 RepID=A0A5N0E8E7_9NOCA|nr:hypothetical protein F3087_30850 [Nocardia colli]